MELLLSNNNKYSYGILLGHIRKDVARPVRMLITPPKEGGVAGKRYEFYLVQPGYMSSGYYISAFSDCTWGIQPLSIRPGTTLCVIAKIIRKRALGGSNGVLKRDATFYNAIAVFAVDNNTKIKLDINPVAIDGCPIENLFFNLEDNNA